MPKDRKDGERHAEMARLASSVADKHIAECPVGAFARSVQRHAEGEARKCGWTQVASDAYRANYENIFGKKTIVGQA